MLVSTILLSLLALPASAAEPTGAPQAGREATIHLLDGNVIDCVVLGFAEGSFQITRTGEEDDVSIDKIKRVAFGKAVGESVRNPFAPATPPTSPSTLATPATAKPPEKEPRPVEDLVRSLDPRQLVHRLARWTNRYRNAQALKRTEDGVRRMLAAKPEKGPLDRNLRLLLVLLETAGGETRAANRILDKLKSDYADDELIQEVRVGRLSTIIERIKRSGRGLRRPGERRPPRERDRDTRPPRPGPRPQE